MSRIKKIFKVESAEKRWMNTQEAMAYIGVSQSYLETKRSGGELPYYKDSSIIWYDIKDLDRLILRNKVY